MIWAESETLWRVRRYEPPSAKRGPPTRHYLFWRKEDVLASIELTWGKARDSINVLESPSRIVVIGKESGARLLLCKKMAIEHVIIEGPIYLR